MYKRQPQNRASYHVREDDYCRDYTPEEGIKYQDDNNELWRCKLEEIKNFQQEKTGVKLSKGQVEKLISIYNKYRHIFSDAPGKVKGYQCKLKFREPVEFHKKNYYIAYSLKEALRRELME